MKATVAVDLVLRGGLIYDGTAAAPRAGDVAVAGGRIVPVPPRLGEPTRVIDATGLAVAPGFIDIHTHSDVSVLLDGAAESKVRQGVTTEVTGNCGFSAFPVVPQRRTEHADLLAGLGDDPIELAWTDLDGYAQLAHERGLAVNVIPLVGHGALRIAALGVADRRPTAVELDAMGRLLAQLLDQGAFGLSTGLTYVPSGYAETPELVALCEVLAARGRLYATHSRGGRPDNWLAGIEEARDLGERTGVAVQYSHVAINDPKRWGSAAEVLELLEAARREGVDMAYDVYPYDGSSSALTQYLPAWVQAGGVGSMRARLADPVSFRRAEADLATGWGALRIPWQWDRVLLSRTDGLLGGAEGLSVEAAAAAAGRTPESYALELCREGGSRVQVVLLYRTEEDVRAFLRHPLTLVGSDGSAIPYDQRGRRPHPRAFGAHTRVLGRYARELGDLDLADAIHRMTGAVARRLKLADRGVIADGMAADLVVFDPATVGDRGIYLEPNRPPTGIRYVLVNGQVVVNGDVQTPARPGRVLRAA